MSGGNSSVIEPENKILMREGRRKLGLRKFYTLRRSKRSARVERQKECGGMLVLSYLFAINRD